MSSLVKHIVKPDSINPAVNLDIRRLVYFIENQIKLRPDSLGEDPFPLEHSFIDGLYIRRLTIPKGYYLVGKLHKHPYINFIEKGEVTVISDTGSKLVKAPCTIHSPAGTKRIGKSHSEVIWVTVHANPTNERDIDKLEDMLHAKSYTEFNQVEPLPEGLVLQMMELYGVYDVKRFRKLTREIYSHEKDGFWSDWTEEQQEIYMSGDWEAFSKSRGYTDEEIGTLRQWIELKEEGDRLGIDPLKFIVDLSTDQTIKNIEKDTKGEIWLSSHIPTSKKLPYKDRREKLCLH